MDRHTLYSELRTWPKVSLLHSCHAIEKIRVKSENETIEPWHTRVVMRALNLLLDTVRPQRHLPELDHLVPDPNAEA